MANIKAKDADGSDIYFESTAAGTNLDPHLSHEAIASDTTSLDGKLPSQGQALKSASIPVVLASDQDALPITDNGGSLTVDGADLSTIAGDTTSLDSKVPSQGQAAMAASVPVAIASDQSILSVAGSTAALISAAYTRPADTTAYTDSDSLSDSTTSPTALTFAIARANDITGFITDALCITSDEAYAGALRLWLFQDIPTAINDNAAFTLTSTMLSDNLLGWIDFDTFVTGGTGSDRAVSRGVLTESRPIAYVPSSGTSNIFGLVMIKTGTTPESAQTFEFDLARESN